MKKIGATTKTKTKKPLHNFIIGVTVAPRQPVTINQAIASLRDIGFKDMIFIFAEPGVVRTDITDENVNFILNDTQLGCFGNYNNMCRQLIMAATKTQIPYIATIQDDFLFQPGAFQTIEDMIKYPLDFGYINLHTRPRMERYLYKNGRNSINLGRYAWGMCYMYKREVLAEVLNHPFYQSHLHTYTKNQQIDSCISYVLQLMNKSQLYHNPSLSTHIGDSVIGHIDDIQGVLLDQSYTKRVVGVASIPNREENLRVMINSIYHQVDEIHVYLNGYDHFPDFLDGSKITVHFDFNTEVGDNGDAGKFYTYQDQKDVYYFCMDDDLYYAPNYCEVMIERIEKYERKAVVGLHGIVLKDIQPEITSYYKDRYTFSFGSELPTAVCVQMLGTGVCAMHTSMLKLTNKDFKHPNMGDIFVAIAAQKQKVPMVCIARKKTPVRQQTTNTSIYGDAHRDDTIQTELVNKFKRETIRIPQLLK